MLNKNKASFAIITLLIVIVKGALAQTPIGDLHYVTDNFKTPFSIYAADFDGDGSNDIVAGSSNDSIVWFKNLGMGQFSSSKHITTELLNVRSLFSCDIDNDGDADILSATKSDSTIAWIENLGNANFGSPNIVATNADYVRYVGGYDMDNDNDMDIVACYMNSIVWYINDGDCNFSDPQIISTVFSRNLCVADIDKDNYYDVFTTNFSDEGLLWLKNEGNGTFSNKYVQLTGSDDECIDIDVADIDNNGKMDLITSFLVDTYYGKIGWYEYQEYGEIAYKQRAGLKYEIFQKVVAGDLSSDGTCDIFAAHNDDHGLYWFEKGDPHFKSEKLTYYFMEVSELLLSDMDMDGDDDIVMSSIFSHEIVWFENLTPKVLFQPQDQNVCPHTLATFSTDIHDALNYRWQAKETEYSQFRNIADDDNNYFGEKSNELQIINSLVSMNNYQFRCKATNGNGVIYTDTVTLTLKIDTVPPVLKLKESDLYLTSSTFTGMPINLIIDTLSDNCNYIDVFASKDMFDCTNLGENLIEVTAIDGSGNSVVSTTFVTIIDTVSPSMQLVNNEMEIFSDGPNYTFDEEYCAVIDYSDNCSVESILNSVSNNESLLGVELPLGTTDVIWTITDNSGNNLNLIQKITVTNYNEYNIYPNPTRNYFIIEQKLQGEFLIQIFDVLGQLVFESDKIDDLEYRFECTNLKRGNYIVRVSNGLQVEDYKVVVLK